MEAKLNTQSDVDLHVAPTLFSHWIQTSCDKTLLLVLGIQMDGTIYLTSLLNKAARATLNAPTIME